MVSGVAAPVLSASVSAVGIAMLAVVPTAVFASLLFQFAWETTAPATWAAVSWSLFHACRKLIPTFTIWAYPTAAEPNRIPSVANTDMSTLLIVIPTGVLPIYLRQYLPFLGSNSSFGASGFSSQQEQGAVGLWVGRLSTDTVDRERAP